MSDESEIKLVPVRAFSGGTASLDAEVARNLLAAEGIESMLPGDMAAVTIPVLANALGVTRQHVQTIANELLDKHLVKLLDNPEHKRSKLIALTPRGREIFNEIRRREAPVFTALEAALPADELRAANEALRRLHAFMTSVDGQETRSSPHP